MTAWVFGERAVRPPRKEYESDMCAALSTASGLRTLTPNAELLRICKEKEDELEAERLRLCAEQGVEPDPEKRAFFPAVVLRGAQITAMREHDPKARESEINKWTIEAAGQSFVVPCAFIWRVSPAVGGWLVYKPPSTANELEDDGVGFVPATRVARLYDVTPSGQAPS